MKILQGLAASDGIAMGRTFFISQNTAKPVVQKTISPDQRLADWNRFLTAVDKATRAIKEQIQLVNAQEKAIFESHCMMLSDPEFTAQIKKNYDSSQMNIEYILFNQYTAVAQTLRMAQDANLSQRAEDIEDAFGRVMDVLLNRKPFQIDLVPENTIIAAKNIKPSLAVSLIKRKPLALIVEEGGFGSHLAILARSYGIPAVFAIHQIEQNLSTPKTVIVDGMSGQVFIEPDDKTSQHYQNLLHSHKNEALTLEAFRSRKASTKDGHTITLLANIGSPEEANIAMQEGAEGIGLFRTEFLFMNTNRILDEEEQFEVYKSVLQTMQDKPVTIRTLDSGGDKIIPIPKAAAAQTPPCSAVPKEENPLLGSRAIRFCLIRTDIFITQLRALFRASVFGNLKIMIPLVSGLEELEKTLELVEQVKNELKNHGLAFKPDIPVGIMVELPSAALAADILAKKSDFFSIGTNDLTQYTIAVDRENPAVAELFSEFHPSVLRLIKNTIEAAQTEQISLSVCGEMASRPEGILLLTGMGITTLSMGAIKISKTKELLSRFSQTELSAIAQEALAMTRHTDIHSYLTQRITSA